MNNKSSNLRLYVRIVCFLVAVVLLLPFPFWIDISRIFVQASPFVTICTILAGGTIGIGAGLGLCIAVISLFKKRFFCRYACPVGLLLDTVSGVKLPFRLWWKGFPPVGKYIAILTASGAILGYPLLLWLDPLGIFNNAFTVYKATGAVSAAISLSGIVILILLALTSGSIWCTCLCPLGATQELLESAGSFCRNFRKPVKKDSWNVAPKSFSLPATRRTFIALAGGIGLSLFSKRVGQARSKDAPLRPPGAIKEEEFTGLCMRCGNCTRVCPSGIIHPDTGKAGILGFLAPIIRYEKEYCSEKCNACTMACPSGALQGANLEQKNRYVIGKAKVDTSLCLWGYSDCNTCIRACPYKAIAVQWNEEAYESFPGVDPVKCNGCGACEVVCPTGDLKAIKVRKKTD
jgi:ferredoxin